MLEITLLSFILPRNLVGVLDNYSSRKIMGIIVEQILKGEIKGLIL
jgi:hypothetical protein